MNKSPNLKLAVGSGYEKNSYKIRNWPENQAMEFFIQCQLLNRFFKLEKPDVIEALL